MKRVFLLMFVSALMVTFGFAQTPDAGSNTDPATVKGCLSGSEGNYTIAEDGTRQIFKVTSSSVDLKPHVGHDVKLVGHTDLSSLLCKRPSFCSRGCCWFCSCCWFWGWVAREGGSSPSFAST